MIQSTLIFICWMVFSMWITWGGYLAMMPLKRNIKILNNWNKIFGYPWFVVFLCLDCTFNIVFGTIIFLDLPRELLLTERLDRYLGLNQSRWRHNLAYYFCTRFLDAFDPDGQHCKPK